MKKIFPLFAVIIVLVLAVCSFHIIPTGYTGVKTSFGQIQETTIQSGKLNFCIPFVQSIHKVNNKQQDKHIEAQVWGEASDKTPVYAADVIVTYQVLPEKSAWLYANVSDIKNLVGDELVASAIKSAMAELGPNEVTNRTKIEPLAQQKLAESLVQKYGEDVVFVNKVVVNDMNFEDAYNEAIQQKSIAQQNADKQKIENEAAIAKAEADKQVAITNAEAEAQKTSIAAEAQAEANRKLAESLSDTTLVQFFIIAPHSRGAKQLKATVKIYLFNYGNNLTGTYAVAGLHFIFFDYSGYRGRYQLFHFHCFHYYQYVFYFNAVAYLFFKANYFTGYAGFNFHDSTSP